MSMPAINCQLAFGLPFSSGKSWAGGDVSAFVCDRVRIRRGRRNVFSDVEAGTATVTLRNTTRRFDPENTDDPIGRPFLNDLKPMVPVRITATYDSTTYPLFQGFVTDFQPRYPGGAQARIDLQCVDGFEPLARLTLGTSDTPVALAQADADVRISDTLDAVGWPVLERVIDTETIEIQASSLEEVPALEHLLAVARSVGGLFFIDREGKATFQSGGYRSGLSAAGPFGDAADGTELLFAALDTTYGATQIYNRVVVQNQALPGDTPLVVVSEDSSSISAYLPRILTRSGMLLTNDTDAETIADTLLAYYKDPKTRVQRMVIDPSPDSWPVVLAADLSTRLVVHRTGLNGGSMLDLNCYVEGIGWEFWLNDNDAGSRLTWDLSST